MRLAPPSKVSTRSHSTASRWEGVVLYLTAYLCTFIAIAAAQLSLDTSFVLIIALVTLLGLPLSLWLRWSKLSFGGYRIPRPLVNSLVVIFSITASVSYIVLTNPTLFTPQAYQTFMVEQNAGEAIKLLMKTFLILAACRSLAIINDKDAVLCTVPSFSVLLLLIVVHRGPEVVVFFLMWSIAAAVLFALDHRAEARERVIGFVPSVVPGQDVSLSARGLVSVMGLSLACAVGLSYVLTSRNPSDRSLIENWMIMLASQFTQRTLRLPEASSNAGPEQQIDFSTSPNLPSRTPLWDVQAIVFDGATSGILIRPRYWRMFTLGTYNGKSWTQSRGTVTEVPSALRWRGDRQILAFDIKNRWKTDWNKTSAAFGSPSIIVTQRVRAIVMGTGFIPALPAAYQMSTGLGERFSPFDMNRMQDEESMRSLMRIRIGVRNEDHALRVGVIQGSQTARIRSEVPQTPEYDTFIPGRSPLPPLTRAAKGQEANSLAQLSAQERQMYLQLPRYLMAEQSGVLRFVRKTLAAAGDDESDYRRAQRLATELQRDATYTLRPPPIPPGRDATEFFLENRRGYCTYYAGALAVLCRAAGIPARVVSGFAVFDEEQLEDDDLQGWVRLREANAHAWTEVWVPGWGWSIMDATPADNRGNNAPGWWEYWTELFGMGLNDTKAWLRQHSLKVLFFVPLLLAIGLLAFGNRIGLTRGNSTFWKIRNFFKYWLGRLGGARFRAWLENADVEGEQAVRRAVVRVYDRAATVLARRFRQRTPAETPHEWFDAAQRALELRDPGPLQRLTDLYVEVTYSPLPIPPESLAEARTAFNNLSWQRLPSDTGRRSFLNFRKRTAAADA